MADKSRGIALGRHMTVEFYDCSPKQLSDETFMHGLFIGAAKYSGATVISSHFHTFEPQGVSGVVIISESHFTVHAWPEHDYAAVDLFTCGDGVDFKKAIDYLAKGLESNNVCVSNFMHRGIFQEDRGSLVADKNFDINSRLSNSWEEYFSTSNPDAISILLDITSDGIEKDIDTLLKELGEIIFKEALVIETLKNGQWQINSSTGNIILRKNEQQNIYLDCFFYNFIEPREFATEALKVFNAKRYRMQVQSRR